MKKTPLQDRLSPVTPISTVAQVLVDETNLGNESARYWLEPMARFGFTAQLMHDIEHELANAEIPLRVVATTTTKKIGVTNRRLMFMYNFERLTERQLFAVNVARLDQEGWLDHIRRCAECEKYFVGDVRARWCSPTCGSRFRVNKKRRSDRAKKKAAKGIAK